MISLSVLLFASVSYALAGAVQKTLELTWKNGSPDGFEREMIFINNEFPGPLLEINQGDAVEITVVNNMPFNTTIHYHGIDQQHSPWADGVPGLSQRPIQPGANYTYKWSATQYGSYFYHAHSRGQIDDGCYGPIIIHAPRELANPFHMISASDVGVLRKAASDVTPVIISDWRHMTSEKSHALQSVVGVESSVCMDSVLVNGKGQVNCWTREDIDKFTSPAFKPLLEKLGLKITDKGCLPPKLLEAIQGSPANLSTLPPDVFDICTPQDSQKAACIQAPVGKKWVALDFISSAGVQSFGVSIDEHSMWIYAADGNYIEPVEVDALNLSNGDRYSVLVKLDKPAGQYGIRVSSTSDAQLFNTVAVLTYSGNKTTHGGYGNHGGCDVQTLSSTPSINQAGKLIKPSGVFFDPLKIVSFPPQYPLPAPSPDQTVLLDVGIVGKSYQWALNGTMFDNAIDDSAPPLLYRAPPNTNSTNHFTIVTKNDTWVDLIFKMNTFPQPAHPIHKHSNKVFVIGSGQGTFNWTTVAEASAAIPDSFNLVNPPFRDTFETPPALTGPTWLAVRYHVENPGAFLLHCHIQSHVNGGMAMVMLDGVDEWPEVPDDLKN